MTTTQVGVPTASVRAGDVLRVLPGERVPVDGAVLAGRCSADESMLTGESALVPKGEGSQVRGRVTNGNLAASAWDAAAVSAAPREPSLPMRMCLMSACRRTMAWQLEPAQEGFTWETVQVASFEGRRGCG